MNFVGGICEGKDGHGGDERRNISNNSDMAFIDDEESIWGSHMWDTSIGDHHKIHSKFVSLIVF